MSNWSTDYAEALKTAAKEKKSVLMDFTGSDWCGWCVRLKEEVFGTPEFAAWASRNVVLLELDFPRRKRLTDEQAKQNGELQARFRIAGYPTIVFVDADGKELGRTGYVSGGAAAWIQEAERAIGGK